MSPLTLALFNLAYVALAYPAGALSDRMSPRTILMAGHGRADRRQPRARRDRSASPGWSSAVDLWGAHMALTQGIFARMIADSAPEELRATSFGAFWFVSGIGGAARQPRRRLAVGPRGQLGDLPRPAPGSPRWRWRCSACCLAMRQPCPMTTGSSTGSLERRHPARQRGYGRRTDASAPPRRAARSARSSNHAAAT